LSVATYEVQFKLYTGEWFTVSVWSLEPRHLDPFLLLVKDITYSNDENFADIRVRRVPYSYGAAEWEFDGVHVLKAVH
jgi:hypothetical protein